MLFRRSANPGLPGARDVIDFDQERFISQGLEPDRLLYIQGEVG